MKSSPSLNIVHNYGVHLIDFKQQMEILIWISSCIVTDGLSVLHGKNKPLTTTWCYIKNVKKDISMKKYIFFH